MGTEISRSNENEPASTSPEVEFALVLARMIELVKNDPEQLRDTVYELARRKLQEQFTNEDAQDVGALTNALELAIRGVEDFSKKSQWEEALPKPPSHARSSSPKFDSPRVDENYLVRTNPVLIDTPNKSSKVRNSVWQFTTAWRYISVLTIILAIGIVIERRGAIFDIIQQKQEPSRKLVGSAPQSSAFVAQRDPPPLPVPPQKASRVLPSSYGIYAVSEEKLHELELLPGRAPDLRVAISPAIATPSRVTLADGHIKFVVFRRDSASNAADRAEVRVIARIKQAVTFDAAGKQVVTQADDAWVMRNIELVPVV